MDPAFTAPKNGVMASLLLAASKRDLKSQWYYRLRPKARSQRIKAINALIRRNRKLLAGKQEVLKDLPQASLQFLLRYIREEYKMLEEQKHPFRQFLNAIPLFLEPGEGVAVARRELETIEEGLVKVLQKKTAVPKKTAR